MFLYYLNKEYLLCFKINTRACSSFADIFSGVFFSFQLENSNFIKPPSDEILFWERVLVNLWKEIHSVSEAGEMPQKKRRINKNKQFWFG